MTPAKSPVFATALFLSLAMLRPGVTRANSAGEIDRAVSRAAKRFDAQRAKTLAEHILIDFSKCGLDNFI